MTFGDLRLKGVVDWLRRKISTRDHSHALEQYRSRENKGSEELEELSPAEMRKVRSDNIEISPTTRSSANKQASIRSTDSSSTAGSTSSTDSSTSSTASTADGKSGIPHGLKSSQLWILLRRMVEVGELKVFASRALGEEAKMIFLIATEKMERQVLDTHNSGNNLRKMNKKMIGDKEMLDI